MPNTTSHLTVAFGAELECYLPEGATSRQAADAVAQRIGERVNVESYNHAPRPAWKVVTDGSLGDVARGIEFVSPKLYGAAGLAQLEAVCRALSDFGCTVSRKCGFHIHVDATGQSLAFHKKLARLYQTYEPVIDRLMPPSRRDSANAYCRSIASVPVAAIESAASVAGLASAIRISSGAAEARYHKLNLAAFARHQTVEFRQHSGTLDAAKARIWATLCLRMVATAKRAEINFGSTAAAPRNKARPGSKAHIVGQLLLRPEGVTGIEAMAATNWPSISLPQQARICGIDFTTVRTGRMVRYFARTAAPSAPPAPITLDGFAEMLGATETERSYMIQRTADLGGPITWAA